jgi:YHS domain-containing protein
MGDPITQVYQGQQVKFCCKACIAKFHKDPAKYLAKL